MLGSWDVFWGDVTLGTGVHISLYTSGYSPLRNPQLKMTVRGSAKYAAYSLTSLAVALSVSSPLGRAKLGYLTFTETGYRNVTSIYCLIFVLSVIISACI